MKILVFDAEGELAHFRKVYTNSSSMSYYVPPRTTCAGMVAAILGLERDSYYDEFAGEEFKVAVRIQSPLRKMVHTVNYMFVKGLKDLEKRKQGTQVPLELVAGVGACVQYRFYVHMQDTEKFDRLCHLIRNNKSSYIPSFGALPFLCRLRHVGEYEVQERESDQTVTIHSVANLDSLVPGTVELNAGGKMKLVKETMPVRFRMGRGADSLQGYLLDYGGGTICAKVQGNYYAVDQENILFL